VPIEVDIQAGAEQGLLDALRAGDEVAFASLVRRHHATLRRVVRAYVGSDALADEVVQETWLAVIRGLDRFEARSSLKTWIFQIATNIAKTRGARERRTVPLSALAGDDADGGAPSVPPERFMGPDQAWPGHWATPPRPWEDPERRVRSLEVRERLRACIAELPAQQQAVLTLRDVEGLSSDEVCELLALSPGNQRVLLHRARSRLRASLESYMES
jgi:RNA polymerase sigma-70 factor (ECF subfamily)